MIKYCPFCKNPLLKIEGIGSHLYSCGKKHGEVNKKYIRFLYLSYNFPDISKEETLKEEYEINLKSLPEIKEKYSIDYKSTQFLLRFHQIRIRGQKEVTGSEKTRNKYKKTCLLKYGAENALCSGTEPTKKRDETIKRIYGVANVFSSEEIQKIIFSDELYFKKYGMSRSSFQSKRAKKVWENISEERKEEWLSKSLLSEKCRENIIRKGMVSSSLEDRIKDILLLLNIPFEQQFTLKIKDKRAIFDFILKDSNILLEINGDYYHANPSIYKENDIIFSKHNIKTAGDIWNKDKRKKKIAKYNNYTVITIWEQDILKNKFDKKGLSILLIKSIFDGVKNEGT